MSAHMYYVILMPMETAREKIRPFAFSLFRYCCRLIITADCMAVLVMMRNIPLLLLNLQ